MVSFIHNVVTELFTPPLLPKKALQSLPPVTWASCHLLSLQPHAIAVKAWHPPKESRMQAVGGALARTALRTSG